MTPNRVVAVLTPLIFAPLAGAAAAWLAEHFPGFQVDQKALEEIFIAGALIALAPAIQWLHGWQKFEAREAELKRDLVLADATAGTEVELGTGEEESPEIGDTADLDEFTDLDEPAGVDELAEELAELEQLAEMDEFDEGLLSEDEDPALAGS
jgi:hypothetical protein